METLLRRLSAFQSRYPTAEALQDAWLAYDTVDDAIRQNSPFESLLKACYKVSVTISREDEVVYYNVRPLLVNLWKEENGWRDWMVLSAKNVLAAHNEGRMETVNPAFKYAAILAASMVAQARFTQLRDIWVRRDPDKAGIFDEVMSLVGNAETVNLDTLCDTHTTLEEVVDFFTFFPSADRLQWLSVCNLITPSRGSNDFGALEVLERMYTEHARPYPLELEVTNCLVSSDATTTYSQGDNVQRPFDHDSDAMVVVYGPHVRQWPEVLPDASESTTDIKPLQELVQQLCVLSCVPHNIESFVPGSRSLRPRKVDTAWLAKRLVEVLHDTGMGTERFLREPINISDPYDSSSVLEVRMTSVQTTKEHKNAISSLRLGSLLLKVLFADGLFEGGLNLLNIDHVNRGLAQAGNYVTLYGNIINNASYNLTEQRERIFKSRSDEIDWRNKMEDHMDNEILDRIPRLQGTFLSNIGPVVGTTLFSIGRDDDSKMTCKNRNGSEAFIAKVIDGEIAVYRNKTPRDFARRHIPIEEAGLMGVHFKISAQQPGTRLSPDEVVAALLAGAYGAKPGRWALNKIHELGLARMDSTACYLGENAKREGGKIDPRVQMGANVFNNIALVLSGKEVYYSTNGTTMRKVVDKGLSFHIEAKEVPIDPQGKLCRVEVSKPVA